MSVRCTPNRQEADNRNSSACSQSAESYRRPKQEWQREKEKSRIRSRSKFIKDSVADPQQTKKESASFQVTRNPGFSQGLKSVRRPCYNQRDDYQCGEGI